MSKMRRPTKAYIAEPSLTNVALTHEEIRDLVEALPLQLELSGAEVAHLITRVKALSDEARNERGEMSKRINELSMRLDMASHPAKQIMMALQAMTPTERDKAIKAISRSEVAAATEARENAARAQTVALSAANRARFALAKIMEDPRVPADLKEEISTVLETMGAPAVTPVLAPAVSSSTNRWERRPQEVGPATGTPYTPAIPAPAPPSQLPNAQRPYEIEAPPHTPEQLNMSSQTIPPPPIPTYLQAWPGTEAVQDMTSGDIPEDLAGLFD